MHFPRNGTSGPVFCASLLLALISFPAMNLCHAATPENPSNGSSAPQTPAAAPHSATAPPPDIVLLTDGDRIYGTFVREVDGKVVFHSAILGDLVIPWANVKELHTETKMAILDKNTIPRRGKLPTNLPEGTLNIENGLITVHPENNATIEPIPVAKAQYIMDAATLRKQVLGHPGFMEGWNGSATAGATIVHATERQYTFTGSVALVRTVPTVSFLDPANRTSVDFTESYGKIISPAYITPTVDIPQSEVKSSILHFGAERDEYFSPRAYVLGMVDFDHNYSQSLSLQQIYGGGLGYTLIKKPKQALDIKGTIQYERQSFLNAPPGSEKSLIGSTFAGTYTATFPHGMIFNQQVAYIPAYNDFHAYSADETDTLAFPAYKNFSFSIGTLDSYLNDPPSTFPPTLRNSFQFTFGATYAIKSKY
jgi:Protein of unknown function, DUF481